MAKADRGPEEQDRPLVLSSFVECPRCELLQEVDFVAPEGVTETQDLVEALSMPVQCPGCSKRFQAIWEGWSAHEDAG